MKISIARLKEIIMEEVARATMEQKGGPCKPGQTWEGDEMGQGKCVDLNEEDVPGSEEYEKRKEKEDKEKEEKKRHDDMMASVSGLLGMQGYAPLEETIEIVDDE